MDEEIDKMLKGQEWRERTMRGDDVNGEGRMRRL